MPPTTLSLDKQELAFLAELLEKGYPFLESLSLLGKPREHVQKQMEEGKGIEEILIYGQKGRIYTHLAFFMKVSSLSQAIESAIHMTQFENDIKKKLSKQCSYPIFLLVFAFVILLFFTNSIIPQMLNSFDMNEDLSLFMMLLKAMQMVFLCMVSMFLTLGCLGFLGACYPKQRSIWLFRYRSKLSLLKDMISYQLAGYLYELHRLGISTKAAFHYVLHVKETSLLHHVMEDMIASLEHGMDLSTLIEQSQLHPSFQKLYRIGASNDSMCNMLALYMKQQEQIWEKQIKIIGLSIQCIAYVFIGFMVLTVYQIMLVPLSMLQTM